MAIKESFMEDFVKLLDGVSFSSNAKKDTFVTNVNFFRCKAEQKIKNNPADHMSAEKGFINQINTLVGKLEKEHTVLKSGADAIRSGIGYILLGEKPEVSKKVQVQSQPTVKKQESVESKPQVVEDEPIPSELEQIKEEPVTEEEPQVESTQETTEEKPNIDEVVAEAMKNCESITIDHANDTKPMEGESQEDFQKRMDAFVNDPAVLNSAKPVEVNVKPKVNQSGNSEPETKSDNKGTVESTSTDEIIQGTESTETKSANKEEIKSSKEDPVNQGSFQTECGTPEEFFEENEDPYDQAFVDHISMNDEPESQEEPTSESVDEESNVEDESTAEEEYEEYYEEEPQPNPKTGKEKLKDAAKLTATIVIPLAFGFGMGYVLGKNAPSKTTTSSDLVKSRFGKKK